MENNEGKKGCYEGKENCVHGMSCCHGMSNCCHNWKKCHMMRRIIMIIVIIIAFCLGTQWGEMKSESRGDANFRGEKMMWGYNTKDYVNNPNLQKGSGSVTVDVKAPVAAPTPAQ